MSTEDSLRYPTGPFQRPSRPLDDARRREMIDAIARTPSEIRTAIRGLSDSQLDTLSCRKQVRLDTLRADVMARIIPRTSRAFASA